MCDLCTGEREDFHCNHPSCSSPGSACACRLSGPDRCPACGHPCLPWYFGVGAHGAPEPINDFFGGEGSENPGYDSFPADRAQLTSAVRGWFDEQGVGEDGLNPSDLDWFVGHLPDRTFQSRGEVLAALFQPFVGTPLSGAEWLRWDRSGAIPLGTRLTVPAGQAAALVARGASAADVFPSGEHRLTRESAPQVGSRSRPPAPGFPFAVLDAEVVFLGQQEQQGKIGFSGKTRSGQPFYVRADVRYALEDAQAFVGSSVGQSVLGGTRPPDHLLSLVVDAELNRAIGASDGSPAAFDTKGVERVIRSALAGAGWAAREVHVQYAGSNPMEAGLAGGGANPFANLPPEMQAMVRARMEAAMQQRTAPSGRPGVSPPSAPVVGAAGTVVCAACGSANPTTVKFCQHCGQPMAAKRRCPQCGKEVGASVKFCGNCGSRLA